MIFDGLFAKGTDYKGEFEKATTELIQNDFPAKWKNQAVKDLTDAYIEQTDEIPDSRQLERLANWILSEELTDKHPDKLTRADYPILSEFQAKIRRNRELSSNVNKLSREKVLNGKRKRVRAEA